MSGVVRGDSGRGTASTGLEHKCSVCLELFTEPKVLPCCHTFCLECLKKTATSGGQVTCPKCRKVHGIPAGGLTAFLTDFIEAHGVEARRLGNATQYCGECGERGPLSHFCSDCQKHLCSECGLGLHKKLKIYNGHKVYSPAETTVSKLSSKPLHYCPVHKAEVLKLYCETCEKVVCRDCTLVEHRQHNYKFIQDARNQIDREMRSLKSDVERKFAVFRHDLQEIKRVEAATAGHPEVVKADINCFFDNLVRAIEARRSFLLKQAEAVCQKDLKQVCADKLFHEVTISHISAVFCLVNKALKCTNDTEMALTALQSINQLRIIAGREWENGDFANVVLLTPTFEREMLTVGKIGGIGFRVADSKGLEILNPYGCVRLNANYIFKVSYDTDEEPLVDGRTGREVSLRQANTPALKVFVRYGQSKKELDTAYISIAPMPHKKAELRPTPKCQPATNCYQNCVAENVVTGIPPAFMRHKAELRRAPNSHPTIKCSKNRVAENRQHFGYRAVPPLRPDSNQQSCVMYKVTVSPVCGGAHTATITYDNRAITHLFSVSGMPRNGDFVRRGPDWTQSTSNPPVERLRYAPTTVQQEVLGRVCYRAPGEFVGRRKHRLLHYGAINGDDDVLTVISTDGQASEYNWGRNGEYEVQLARL